MSKVRHSNFTSHVDDSFLAMELYTSKCELCRSEAADQRVDRGVFAGISAKNGSGATILIRWN